jgi:hypothetical protein
MESKKLEHQSNGTLYTKTLFEYSRIHISPRVLVLIGVELELNFILIHTNIGRLRCIPPRPNKA